jgi:hypothetical protein
MISNAVEAEGADVTLALPHDRRRRAREIDDGRRF